MHQTVFTVRVAYFPVYHNCIIIFIDFNNTGGVICPQQIWGGGIQPTFKKFALTAYKSLVSACDLLFG